MPPRKKLPSVGLLPTGVTAAQYGSATQAPKVTLNAQGQVTAAENVTVSGTAPGGTAGGDLSATYPNPLVAKVNGVLLGVTTATAGNLLAGSGTAWVSVAVSGDATLSSSGALTIGASKVDGSKVDVELGEAPAADTVASAAGAVSTAFATTYTIPAARLLAKTVIAIRAGGSVTAQAGTITLQLTLRLGGVAVGLITVALDVAANDPWLIDACVVVRTAGAGGLFNASTLALVGVSGAGTNQQAWAANNGSAVDTTVTRVVDVLVDWSAGVGNTVRLDVLTVQVLD